MTEASDIEKRLDRLMQGRSQLQIDKRKLENLVDTLRFFLELYHNTLKIHRPNIKWDDLPSRLTKGYGLENTKGEANE